jgi:hypothetical protein
VQMFGERSRGTHCGLGGEAKRRGARLSWAIYRRCQLEEQARVSGMWRNPADGERPVLELGSWPEVGDDTRAWAVSDGRLWRVGSKRQRERVWRRTPSGFARLGLGPKVRLGHFGPPGPFSYFRFSFHFLFLFSLFLSYNLQI